MDKTFDSETAVEIDTEIVDDILSDAVRQLEIQMNRVLALAYLKGYDGVDIINEHRVATSYDDFEMGFKWEGWTGNSPETGLSHRPPFRRYDFRGLQPEEKRMLTASVGADPSDREER